MQGSFSYVGTDRGCQKGAICISAGKLKVGMSEQIRVVRMGPLVSICREALVEYVGTEVVRMG